MKNEYLLVERSGPVLTLILNHSDSLNPFHPDTIIGLTFAIHHAQRDSEIKVITLIDGGRCSSSNEVNTGYLNISPSAPGFGMLNECILEMKKSRKPIIASVQGFVADAVFNLAFASDIIVASEDSKFSLSISGNKEILKKYESHFQTRLIGPFLKKQFCSIGTPLSALHLYHLGAINYIAPLDKLKEETIKIALRMADTSEKAFGMLKKMIDSPLINALEGILEQERLHNKLKYLTNDHQDGDFCY